MSILKGLEDTYSAQAIVQGTNTEDGIQALEDQMLGECVAVVSAAARFAEIEPGALGPPDEWIEKLGEKEALKAFRVAQQAWLPKKDAAMGIEMCAKLTLGIIQARSKRKVDSRSLQVNLVGMIAPVTNYRMLDEEAPSGNS